MSARNPNHVDNIDMQDLVFINYNNILYNLSIPLRLKTKNFKRFVFGNLNINVTNNKFEQLKYVIKNNIDALIVNETMLDSSFPSD